MEEGVDGLPLIGEREPRILLLDSRLLHGGGGAAAVEAGQRNA